MSELGNLIDKKLLKILIVLQRNKDKLYHITQLALESQVSAATTLRLMKNLLKSNMVTVSNVGKLKIYKYNDTEKNNSFIKVIKQ